MFEDSIIINTILTGAREVVAGAREEAAAFTRLGEAVGFAGDAAAGAGTKWFLASNALFTLRRVAYGLTLTTVVAGAAALKLGYNYLSAMQQARVALAPVFHGTQALNKELNYLYKFSAFTPFQFKDITQSFTTMYKGLQLLGYSASFSNRTIRAITDALAAVPGNATPARLNRVSIALQHLAFVGHLTGQIALQLARDGLPIYPALRKELHLTGDQIHKIGQYGLSSGAAINALNKYIETTPAFAGQAQKQALGSLHGAFTTFKDFLSQAMGGAEGGLFSSFTHFFQGVDSRLAPFVKSGKPITMADFVRAIDATISPRTHLFLAFFTVLGGLLHGIIAPFQILAKLIGYVASAMSIFGGHAKTDTTALRNLGWILGVYIGLLGAFRVGIIAASVWTVIFTRDTKVMTAVIALSTRVWFLFELAMGTAQARGSGGAFRAMTTVEKAAVRLGRAIRLTLIPAIVEATAAAWAWLVPLLLNPITLIVVAVVALAAGLTVLYLKWKPFRDAVNQTIQPLKEVYNLMRKIASIASGHPGHLGWGTIGHGFLGALKLSTRLLGVPGFANGGTMWTSGMAMVGEHGPELVRLPSGAQIDPLDSTFRGMFKGMSIKVYPQAIYLDSKQIGTVLATAVTDAEARQ